MMQNFNCKAKNLPFLYRQIHHEMKHHATRNHAQRRNAFNIPMIDENLRRVLFGDEFEPKIEAEKFDRALKSIRSITKTKDFDENEPSSSQAYNEQVIFFII